MKRVHKLLWSSRYEQEHELAMAECARAVEIGGTFEIENVYHDNWYSIITIYYPQGEDNHG